jgi:vancomycin permeability regulator SanA
MEIAYNQSVQARKILEDAGLQETEVFDDFAGIPRILSARKR